MKFGSKSPKSRKLRNLEKSGDLKNEISDYIQRIEVDLTDENIAETVPMDANSYSSKIKETQFYS